MSEPKRAADPVDDAALPEAVAPRRAASHGRFRWAAIWTAVGTIVPGLGLWHAGRKVAASIVMGFFAAILLGLSGFMYMRAQAQKVDHNNVNHEWNEESNSVVPTTDAKDTTPEVTR